MLRCAGEGALACYVIHGITHGKIFGIHIFVQGGMGYSMTENKVTTYNEKKGRLDDERSP